MRAAPALALCLALGVGRTASADVGIEDFEDVSDWTGLTLSTATVAEGAGAGAWLDHVAVGSVRRAFTTPLDLSASDAIVLWLHSARANGAELELVLDSENPAVDGWDYYRAPIVVDWVGWRRLRLPRRDFLIARSPVGWHQIRAVSLHASGWGHTGRADSALHLDGLVALDPVLAGVDEQLERPAGGFRYRTILHLLGGSAPIDLEVDVALDAGSPWTIRTSPSSPLTLPAGARLDLVVDLEVDASQLAGLAPLARHTGAIVLRSGGLERERLTLEAVVPTAARPSPRVLLDAADFARIQAWAARQSWAADRRDAILRRADAWPASHLARYGLSSWAPPPEGGQWGNWYVCPDHAVNLRFESPDRSVCPVDGRNWTGYPYAQVIYARRHDEAADAARDLGLAWQLDGDPSRARAAAAILLEYAARYEAYPLHDTRNGGGRSGARVLAQTLDESGWLISMAWAYDLIRDTLAPAEQATIEARLLRPAVEVIRRNDAGQSNWQSWHDAAIAAAGVALDDPRLIHHALRGPSGLDFQLGVSVDADGFWYEGSWGYHFYALDALTRSALIGEKAGVARLDDPRLASMYRAPVRFALGDRSLPAFNDAAAASLSGNRRLFEAIAARLPDAALRWPLADQPRTEDGLFFGLESVPSVAAPARPSAVFPASGYVALRAGRGDTAHELILDYGPHGGWHGHRDKLGFVSYGHGAVLGLDPGSGSYAAPTHDGWDRTTVAHNTLIVDEQSQAEATGRLERAVLLDGIGFVYADAGEVYPNLARVTRQLLLLEEYAIDVVAATSLDGANHRFDLIYHQAGEVSSPLPLAPWAGFGSGPGYRYLTGTTATSTDADLVATFDRDGFGPAPYGSVWASAAGTSGRFTVEPGPATDGAAAGRIDYDFGSSGGYVLYTTAAPPSSTVAPSGVELDVFGDGSRHLLELRLMDASGERWVRRVGPIDWTGWRHLAIPDRASWSHYLGDANGVFDLPTQSLVIGVISQAGGPPSGTIRVDALTILEPGRAGAPFERFEQPRRRLSWQLLGAPDTRLVLGRGLGPNRLEPVPFALARREAFQTAFVGLLELHGLERRVRRFVELGVGGGFGDAATAAFELESDAWQDRLMMIGESGGRWQRIAAASPARVDLSSDGVLVWARRDRTGHLLALAAADATNLSVDGVELLRSGDPRDPAAPRVSLVARREGDRLTVTGTVGAGPLRLYGPGVTELRVGEASVGFTIDGPWVVLGGAAAPDAGVPDAALADADPVDADPADADPADASWGDADQADASWGDAEPPDADPSDAGPQDVEALDATPLDLGIPDAGGADAAATDAAWDDASSADATAADASSADASPADASSADASPADASPADASPTDAAGSPDAATDASPADAAGSPDAATDAGPGPDAEPGRDAGHGDAEAPDAAEADEADAGCGCASTGRTPPGGEASVLIGLALALASRRRRERRACSPRPLC
jgi:MYXO-CTERM domain-containing protein